MFNNNLDYEKNSNTTTTSTTQQAVAATTTTTTPTQIRNIINNVPNTSNSHANRNSNINSNTNTNVNTNTNRNSNDNSYFSRFDNRIAANLAAVINGARFRSSSCSKTTPKRYQNSKINHTRNNSNTNVNSDTNTNSYSNTNLHSNSILNSNANTITTNSNSSLHLNNGCFDGGNNIDGVGCGVDGSSNVNNGQLPFHYNGTATLNNITRQQQIQPLLLQLNNIAASGKGSRPGSPLLLANRIDAGGTNSMGRRRPFHLFSQVNLNCNDNEKVTQTPSSDEDNSPTELNNCKRLADKPPLVKRLTMGLLRMHEDSRPLVNSATPTSTASVSPTSAALKTNTSHLGINQALYSNGYINEEAFEPERFIASKFGDSCRQSLTAIPMLDTMNFNDNSEFNLKKRYLRETSSANSSPKIFANRLRGNTHTAGGHSSSTVTTNSGHTHHTINNSGLAFTIDDDESELKDACWFQAGISREIAVEVLSSKSPGAFLVRKSSSKPGCYALTLRVPSPPGPKIANYIILRTARGYKIKGFRKEFSSLKALITHHSVMPELLPIPLAMPRPTNMTSSRRNLDDFDTYDSLQMLLKYLRAKNLENGE